MIITHTNATSWSRAKPNLHNCKCAPGQEIRSGRAPSKSYQCESHQPTDGLESQGPGRDAQEVSAWLKKRRSSRQSPDVVQLLEVQKRRIQQVKVGRDEQWCRRETRTLQYL